MARSNVDKGTHYQPSETEQRSYYLPRGLGDSFKQFCNGNASTGIRGAIVVFMALDDMAGLREEAIRAAEKMPIAAARDKIKRMLIEEVGLKALQEWAKSLPEGERAKILASVHRER
jgi:hypothetical protein